MASRRNLPPPYEERALENRLASQGAEIEKLAGDNHKLATSHLALRRDLVAAQEEAEKLRDHIRSLRTEGDIQIRILLDKIAKMEGDIRAGDGVRKEFEEAHREAHNLVTSRTELSAQIQQATRDLDNARADIKRLPEMQGELDNIRQEHQTLRKTFEHEKGANVEKVEQMKTQEKDLIAMAEEVERLRAEVVNANNRATAPIPLVGPFANSANLYPPPMYANGGYVNSFNGPPHIPSTVVGAEVEGQNFYPGGGFAVGPPLMNGPTGGGFAVGPPLTSGAAVTAFGAGNPAWGGAYDTSSHTHG